MPGQEKDPEAERGGLWYPYRSRDEAFHLRGGLRGIEDDLLVAIDNGSPLPTNRLILLPPWRAAMLARIAEKAGVILEHGTSEQIEAVARAVGGAGELTKWWEAPGA